MLITASQLSADTQTGSISGKVRDVDFAEPIRAAVVSVVELEKSTKTDLEGRFQIREIPPGSYTVVVSKGDFTTVNVSEVLVEESESFTLNVVMSPDWVFELATMEITAEEATNMSTALLSDRQRAAGVSDAMGSEFMERAGAGDAAEAMTRMAGANIVDGKFAVIRGLGDRYGNTLINGAVLPSNDPSKKSVQLDIIPSDLLEKIVTTKSFTPDKPGDFTGGSVEITTKPFPEQFVFNVSAGIEVNNATGEDIMAIPGRDMDFFGKTNDGIPAILPKTPSEYNVATRFKTSPEAIDLFNALHKPGWYPETKTAAPNTSFAFTVGDSIPVFKEGLFGYLASYTYSHDFDLIENKTLQRWIGKPDSLNALTGFDVTESNEEISTGALVNLALLPTTDHEISYNYLLNNKNNDFVRFGDNGFEVSTNITKPGIAVSNSNLPIGRDEAIQFLQILNLQHVERSLKMHQFKGKHLFESLGTAKLNWSANFSETSEFNPNKRSLTMVKYLYPDGDSDQRYITDNPKFPFQSYQDLTDTKNNYITDLTIPLNLNFISYGEIKLGGFYSLAKRDSLGRFFSARGHNTIVTTPDSKIELYNRFEEDIFINQTYPTDGYFRDSQIYYSELTVRGGNVQSYAGEEEISAYYLMTDFELKDGLRIIAGARNEQTDMEVETIEGFVNVALENAGSIRHSQWLPAFHIVKPLGSSFTQNLRFSYGKTLARPTFREFSPFRVEDPQTGEIYEGNPDLEITLTDNFDLRWEWFFGEADVLSAGIYYKDFSNPIVQTVSSGVNSRPRYSWENTESGQITGIELEVRKEIVKNWSVGGNVTFIESSLDPIPDAASDSGTVFEEQPDLIANANIGYDNPENGWASNLFFNYVGENLRFVGGEIPNIYEASKISLDFNISKTFGKWSVKFSAKNLTDTEHLLFYGGTNEQPIYEKYRKGRTFSLSGSFKY